MGIAGVKLKHGLEINTGIGCDAAIAAPGAVAGCPATRPSSRDRDRRE